MYIVFEGIDTSGKSTQAKLLHQKLKNSILTKEPGGTKVGEEIRELVLHKGVKSFKSELFLFLADRAEHYELVLKPNREKIIISDRSFISGISYALANHSELDMEFLLELNQFALDNYLPTHAILLKSNEEILKKRLDVKSQDAIESRGIAYLLKIQENMLKVLEKLNINSLIIDADKDIDEIHNQIVRFIHD